MKENEKRITITEKQGSLEVRIINNTDFPLPAYETIYSAGMDLRANDTVTIPPGGRRLVHTGIAIELPIGYEAQIRPRSGLAFKKGITVLNSPGTIDADYRGEIGVILHNASNVGVSIFKGDRIAQMVVAKHERVEWVLAKELSDTARGIEGFGSTGQ